MIDQKLTENLGGIDFN